MKTISVPLQSYSYPIWIDHGLLNILPKLLKPMNQGQYWVIFSQSEIYLKYGEDLENSLKLNGFKTIYVTLPNGEKAKSLKTMQDVFSTLLKANCNRSSTFLALGGGVVGDLTGFLAATFMRGVDYIQIPTSLLAMVDSSIGGKTGINLSEGKNLVGSFWQPKAVVIDLKVLQTLPKREFTSALGEVIKYGAIIDEELFMKISDNLDDLLIMKNDSLILEIIMHCAKIKADIVSIDEREGDKRKILNFGHTIGHALETYFGFDILRHGEAIAYGMILAANLSMEYSKFSRDDYEILKKTILKLPLPDLPKIDENKIMNIMQNDKKIQNGSLNFILLEKIGRAVVKNNIDQKSIIKVLGEL